MRKWIGYLADTTTLYSGFIKPISSQLHEKGMVDFTHFWLSTIVIIVLIACYVLFIVRSRLKKDSPDSSVVPVSLQETKDELLLATSKDLPANPTPPSASQISSQVIDDLPAYPDNSMIIAVLVTVIIAIVLVVYDIFTVRKLRK